MSELVIDASAVVAWLLDASGTGARVAEQLSGADLAAPSLLPAEVTSALRRAEMSRELDPHTSGGALWRGLALPVSLHAFAPLAARIWQLRHVVTPYDAWYVALAEGLGVPLLTLDARLARAPGLRCEIVLP